MSTSGNKLATKIVNRHIHLTGEPRGNHLTNRCLTANVRSKGFFIKGWRNEVHMNVEYGGIGTVEMLVKSGSLEINILLTERPLSNVFTYHIRTKGLNFYYQPAFTQKELDEGFVRPENVVGSYAVYHSTKKHNFHYADSIEKNYKTGKAFHIFRPKAIDANNAQVWADLKIDSLSGTMTVTVPQKFLDSAVYPIVIDPNFGYDNTAGMSLASTAEDNVIAIRTVMGNPVGMLESITHWVQDYISLGPFNVWTAIYSDDSGNRLPLDREEECSAPTVVPLDHDNWLTCDHSGNYGLASNTVYWLAFRQSDARKFYFDTVGTNDYANHNITVGEQNVFEDPWAGSSHIAGIAAIYGTYVFFTTIDSAAHIVRLETETIDFDAHIYGVVNIDSDAEIIPHLSSAAHIVRIGETETLTSDTHIHSAIRSDAEIIPHLLSTAYIVYSTKQLNFTPPVTEVIETGSGVRIGNYDVKLKHVCDHLLSGVQFALSTCTRCLGTGIYYDITYSSAGTALTVRLEAKLVQALEKIVLTSENKFHPDYAAGILKYLGRAVGREIIGIVKQDITRAVALLKERQKLVPNISSRTQIATIDKVTVVASDDPTILAYRVQVTAVSGEQAAITGQIGV